MSASPSPDGSQEGGNTLQPLAAAPPSGHYLASVPSSSMAPPQPMLNQVGDLPDLVLPMGTNGFQDNFVHKCSGFVPGPSAPVPMSMSMDEEDNEIKPLWGTDSKDLFTKEPGLEDDENLIKCRESMAKFACEAGRGAIPTTGADHFQSYEQVLEGLLEADEARIPLPKGLKYFPYCELNWHEFDSNSKETVTQQASFGRAYFTNKRIVLVSSFIREEDDLAYKLQAAAAPSIGGGCMPKQLEGLVGGLVLKVTMSSHVTVTSLYYNNVVNVSFMSRYIREAKVKAVQSCCSRTCCAPITWKKAGKIKAKSYARRGLLIGTTMVWNQRANVELVADETFPAAAMEVFYLVVRNLIPPPTRQ